MAIKNSDLYSAYWDGYDELHGRTKAIEETDYALVIPSTSGWRQSSHGKTQ
jgi:hypothetical protein